MSRSASVWLFRAALCTLLAGTATIYFWRLADSPVYVSTDEARFAVQAAPLSTTGRDLHGVRLPVFFLISDPLIANNSSVAWWQPAVFYLVALSFRVAGVSTWSTRAPVASLAVLNVALMYFLSRRIFGRRSWALVAALLLALTPAHFIFGRLALDYFCPLTFVLFWLWCLLQLKEARGPALALACGLILGLGLYSYITSWVVMPTCLATSHALLVAWHKPARWHAWMIAGFAFPLVPAGAWLFTHPTLVTDLMTNYHVSAGGGLGTRVSLYWGYFNPSYLFFAGASNLKWSTRLAGVFPLAFAILLPVGAWSVCRFRDRTGAFFLLAALLTPLPIVLSLPETPEHATSRHLVVVPFAVIIAVHGLVSLSSAGPRWRQVLAVATFLAVPAQFVVFASDYFTDYRARSAFWFDSLNMQRVAEAVIGLDGQAPVPAVWLNLEDLGEDKSVRLRFHLLARHRMDLWDRTAYSSPARLDAADAPPGSLAVLAAANGRVRSLLDSGRWTLRVSVTNEAGDTVAAVLRRE